MSWILVTGGAKRLGRSICLELAQRGHRVVIHYRESEREAKLLQKQCSGSKIIQGDFSTCLDDFIRRYLECFPNTKGVVNNVGNYTLGAPSTVNTLDPLIQTNLTAPIAITHALLPSIKQKKGSVVNLGVSGLSHPWTKAAAYGMTKAALLFYTRSLAKELAKDGVRVNMVSPGQLEISEDENHHRPVCASLNVAKFIAHLFEENCQEITGQNIELANGYGI